MIEIFNWLKKIGLLCIVLSILGLGIAFLIAPEWIGNIFTSIDQVVNSLFGGDPTETISSRLGKWLLLEIDTIRTFIAQGICWFLDLFDSNHCINSINENSGDKAIFK